jgi:hypothetical protein
MSKGLVPILPLASEGLEQVLQSETKQKISKFLILKTNACLSERRFSSCVSEVLTHGGDGDVLADHALLPA